MEELDVEPGVAAAEQAADSRSFLDKIKARRDGLEDLSEPVEIPSWGGELLARYKVIAKSELEIMIRRIRGNRNSEGDVTADLDFLIKACAEVIARDAETGEERKLSSGYNMELAELLGEPEGAESARGLVLYLFKNNGIAVSAHAMKVARWMQDTSRPVEDPS